MLMKVEQPWELRKRLRNPPNAVPDKPIDLAKPTRGVDGHTFEKLRRLRREAANEKVRQEASIRLQAKIDAIVARLKEPPPLEEDVVVSHVAIAAETPVCLSPLGSGSRVSRIQKIVCDRYGLKLVRMLSRERTMNVSGPRQIAMYLCKRVALKSLPEIGRRFGGRDHTTVLHAVRKVEAMMADDPAFNVEIQGMIQAIEAEA